MVAFLVQIGKNIFWRVGQAVKTPPSHGGNTGSIPVRAASFKSRVFAV